jgi:hypothetical protein
LGQYILIGSVIDLFYIGFIFGSRIAIDGFDATTISAYDFACKLRNYLGIFLLFTSIWYKFLVAFDRWASTSQSLSIR